MTSASKELVQDFQYRIAQQGLKLEQYLQYMGMNMDQFKAQFAEQAEKQVKMRLAMEAIVAKEGITASDEEFETEVKRIADAYQMEADKVRSVVNEEAVKADLAVNKAIDFIKEKANRHHRDGGAGSGRQGGRGIKTDGAYPDRPR